MNPTEIENRLRTAPRPMPPAELREQLVEQIHLGETSRGSARRAATVGGWRRWWPALAPAAVSAACAVMLTLQQLELRDLKESLRALAVPGDAVTQTPAAPVTAPPLAARAVNPELTPDEEIARLKETIRQASAEVAQLEQTQTENSALRAQLTAPQPGVFTPEEQEAMAKARERAQSIQCVNNLKQIGLATRIWAMDHGEVFPSDFLSMSNELVNPKILVCPGDTNRPVATDWASLTTGNCSYEYLAPSGASVEPSRILTRCPLHGNIGLCDGSVQMGVAKNHPETLVQRDGKLYYEAAREIRIGK